MPYHLDPLPSRDDFVKIAEKCHRRLEAKRNEIGINERHAVYLSISKEEMLRVSMCGEVPELRKEISDGAFTHFEIDPRLLYRALRGPRFANWNNIEIGAHAQLRRFPDVFNPQLHILMNSFHE